MALPASNQALRVFQWGVEATRGTIVPATSRIAVIDMDLEPTDVVTRPQLAKGLILRNRGNETVVARGTKWTVPDSPLNFEQMPNWLSMSVQGGVSPSGVGPYVYAHARNPAADPTVQSWSFERRLSDGTNFIDNKWGYALADKLTWKFAQDKELSFGASGFARRIQGATLTGGKTMPAVNLNPFALVQVWIDSTWATLGNTLMSSQVYGGQIDFGSGLMPFPTADNRSDLDFVTYVLDPTKVTLDVKLLALVANAGAYAAEKTAAEATTLRAVRVKATTDVNHIVQWDMLLKHTLGSVFKVGTLNGQDIVELSLQEATDGTNLFAVTVTNQVATMS